ncbi:MAG: hypothetical protein AAF616_05495 [Bacteroidota bacterium]
MKSISYTLAFTFVAAVSFIFLFLAIAMVPYWQGLSGFEIQAWWSGPFTNFSIVMVPIHLLSLATIFFGFFNHIKGEKAHKFLWIMALLGLLICQIFNFTLFGVNLNPALQSGSLSETEALFIFDDWQWYHNIRTASVCASLLALIVIGSARK